MADDNTIDDAQASEQPPEPNPDLNCLDRLVGTWQMSGDVQGTVAFELMEGGCYLGQHVDIDYVRRKIADPEYIGYDEPNNTLKSYFFSNQGPGPTSSRALVR